MKKKKRRRNRNRKEETQPNPSPNPAWPSPFFSPHGPLTPLHRGPALPLLPAAAQQHAAQPSPSPFPLTSARFLPRAQLFSLYPAQPASQSSPNREQPNPQGPVRAARFPRSTPSLTRPLARGPHPHPSSALRSARPFSPRVARDH